MIPKELAEKYHINTLEEELKIFADKPDAALEWYETFLSVTDHIPNKIVEAQALKHEPEDYSEILTYRQQARDRINELTRKGAI